MVQSDDSPPDHNVQPHDFPRPRPQPVHNPQATPRQCLRQQHLRVVSLNANSIVGATKKAEFHNFLEAHSPDIVAICETKLHDGILNSEVFPSDYTVFRKDRAKKATALTCGGGVAILVRNSLSVRRIKLPTSVTAEIVAVNVKCPWRAKPFFLFCCYRPDEHDRNVIRDLPIALSQVRHVDQSDIIVLGDFNARDIVWASNNDDVLPHAPSAISSRLLDVFESFNLEQHVHEATRISISTSSCLDLVLSNGPLIGDLNVVPGTSDHEAISFQLRIQRPHLQAPGKAFHVYRKADWDKIRSKLNEFSESCFFSSNPLERSVDENWNMLKTKIYLLVSEHVPSNSSSKSKSLPWLNPGVKRMINRQNRAKKKAMKTKAPADWEKYRTARKQSKRATNASQKRFLEKLSVEASEQPKTFWNYIHNVKNERTSIPPLNPEGGGNFAVTDRQKCTSLNEQYAKEFVDEISEVPIFEIDIPEVMEPPVVCPMGVLKQLREQNPHKSQGPDSIHPSLLKHCSSALAPILSCIFNQSLTNGEIPDDWLKANVCPIFKKGEKSNPANYRPISLTSCICKIFEHILVSNIMYHMESNHLLTDRQHGFRRNHSCEGQLISVLQDWQTILDRKSHSRVDAVFLDFSKAFDKVPHERLLHKLSAYGIQGQTLTWIRAFLTNRKQRVVINNETSDWISVTSGVPQGTVLGPCLFLCFINDILSDISCNISLFADDCLVYQEIENSDDYNVLQNDLNMLGEWSQKWLLPFNVSKCVTLTLHHQKVPIVPPSYQLLNESIPSATCTKYLGVTIDSSLSWSAHIKNISASASQVLGLIRRNFGKCTSKARELLYTSLVRSKLEYSSAAWDPYLGCDINTLERVQNRGARFIAQDYRHTTSVSSLKHDLGLPPLESRRRQRRLLTFWDYQHNRLGINNLPELLPPRREGTRLASNHDKVIAQPYSPRSMYLRQSYLYRTIGEWNSLESNIAEAPNRNAFAAGVSEGSWSDLLS